ncbi:f-box domain containing protein [Colletotrichum asianum]
MAPFSHEFDSDIRETSEYFRASPKIIRERFLLYTQLDIVDKVGLTLNSCDYNEICPHMVVHSSDKIHEWSSGPNNFNTDIRTALSQAGNEITGHCPRCPTDYAISVGPNGMRIQAWKDFGSYKFPRDESWTVHVWSKQNSRAKGPIVYHDPGSIRKLEGTYLFMVVSSWFHLSKEATQPSSHVKAGDFCWVPTTHPPVYLLPDRERPPTNLVSICVIEMGTAFEVIPKQSGRHVDENLSFDSRFLEIVHLHLKRTILLLNIVHLLSKRTAILLTLFALAFEFLSQSALFTKRMKLAHT